MGMSRAKSVYTAGLGGNNMLSRTFNPNKAPPKRGKTIIEPTEDKSKLTWKNLVDMAVNYADR